MSLEKDRQDGEADGQRGNDGHQASSARVIVHTLASAVGEATEGIRVSPPVSFLFGTSELLLATLDLLEVVFLVLEHPVHVLDLALRDPKVGRSHPHVCQTGDSYGVKRVGRGRLWRPGRP